MEYMEFVVREAKKALEEQGYTGVDIDANTIKSVPGKPDTYRVKDRTHGKTVQVTVRMEATTIVLG